MVSVLLGWTAASNAGCQLVMRLGTDVVANWPHVSAAFARVSEGSESTLLSLAARGLSTVLKTAGKTITEETWLPRATRNKGVVNDLVLATLGGRIRSDWSVCAEDTRHCDESHCKREDEEGKTGTFDTANTHLQRW